MRRWLFIGILNYHWRLSQKYVVQNGCMENHNIWACKAAVAPLKCNRCGLWLLIPLLDFIKPSHSPPQASGGCPPRPFWLYTWLSTIMLLSGLWRQSHQPNNQPTFFSNKFKYSLARILFSATLISSFLIFFFLFFSLFCYILTHVWALNFTCKYVCLPTNFR